MRQLLEEATRGQSKEWLPPKIKLRTCGSTVGDLKAVLAVHLFGQPADMDAILAMARAHQLQVIEDACEAVGSEYKQRKAGGLGDISVFGFYPNKQVTTGDQPWTPAMEAGITSHVWTVEESLKGS